jgi:hypothetical protein
VGLKLGNNSGVSARRRRGRVVNRYLQCGQAILIRDGGVGIGVKKSIHNFQMSKAGSLQAEI